MTHENTGSFDATQSPVQPLGTAAVGAAPVDDRPHRPADDSEQVYYDGSPMLRGEVFRLLEFGVAGVILLALPFLIGAHMHKMPAIWITATLLGLGVICLFIPVLRVKSVRYRITNYRIDYERGYLGRNIDTLELWHVEDIAFHQSLLDRILNVGKITIVSHDETMPRLEMKGIPNPRPLFESLKQRVIAVKRQRGVVKMDPG